jgi:hypothetical protein
MILGAGIIQLVIIAIIIAGVVGIAIVVARAAGVNVPPWAIQIFWIVIAVLVGVVAIKFLASLI